MKKNKKKMPTLGEIYQIRANKFSKERNDSKLVSFIVDKYGVKASSVYRVIREGSKKQSKITPGQRRQRIVEGIMQEIEVRNKISIPMFIANLLVVALAIYGLFKLF